jgi:hypothetical protein
MAKFLTGNELNSELEKLFEKAEAQIILISPYIKLHDRFISTLRTKKDNPEIEIVIVFGKNEEDLSRSMKEEDFVFFKEFPNIEIRYEKRLHAKYYANESYAILTSMNLYNFSQDNNIEAGVMTKANALSNIATNLMTNVTGEESFDQTAWSYFKRVINQSDLLYKKSPRFESGMLGFSKKYKSSKIETDLLTDFFANKSRKENSLNKDVQNKGKISPSESAANFMNKIKNLNRQIPSETEYLSTTALSKEMDISSKDLFRKFEQLNWIERNNNNWVLTNLGKKHGAVIKQGQYGEFIAWPSSIIPSIR